VSGVAVLLPSSPPPLSLPPVDLLFNVRWIDLIG
jgi:hypothetical protein